MFASGMKVFADAYATAGLDVYGYNFDAVTMESAGAGLGACHALELPFVFNTLPAEGISGEEHEKLAAEMHGRWADFIKYGNPNPDSGPREGGIWPKYEKDAPHIMRFGAKVQVVPLPDREDFNFMTDILYGDH